MKFNWKRLWMPVEILISAVVVLTLYALSNWLNNAWELTAFRVDLLPMAPTTGLVILLLSLAALLAASPSTAKRWKAVIYSLLGILNAYSIYIIVLKIGNFGISVIDKIIAIDHNINSIPVGTMSPLSALVAVLTSLTLLFSLSPFCGKKILRLIGISIALINILFCVTMALSYAAGMPIFYGDRALPMALFTALAFMMLNLALLGMYGRKNWMLGIFYAELTASDKKPHSNRSETVFVVLALSAVIALGGFVFLGKAYTSAQQQAFKELKTIGDLKAEQISRWYVNHLDDANQVRENNIVQKLAVDVVTNRADANSISEILIWMQMRQKNYKYYRFALYDKSGREILNTMPALTASESKQDTTFAAVIKQNRILVTDLHEDARISPHKPALIHLNIWVPVTIDNKKTEGAWLIQLNPATHLYPLIMSWPTYSKTGETLLVRRDGNEVVYLNELRGMKDAAFRLRFDIGKYNALPAVKVVQGKIGVVEGMDYRSKPVLAAVRPVDGTPWFIVAKIDRNEIYGPLRTRTWTIWSFVLILILMMTLAVSYRERRRDQQWMQRQYDLNRERQQYAERIANLTMHANDIILMLDKDCNIIEANQKAIETYGYTEAELKKLNLYDLRIQDEREKLKELAWDSLANEGIRLETTHVAKDGRQIYVESSIHSILIEGEIYQQAIIRDITDRTNAENELRLSEEKFRKAFVTSPDAITITRASDGMFISVNQGFTRITGYSEQEAIGKTSLEMTVWKNPADRDKVVAAILTEGEIRNFEADFTYKTGEIRGLMSATLIEIDKEKYILSIIRDITDRYRDETALKISEERFRNVFNNSPLGKSLTQITGEMKVNHAFCDILGYSEAELLAKKWTDITHPDDIQESKDVIAKLLAGEEQRIKYEKRYLHKNGNIIWADICTTLQRDENNKPLYFITSISDITTAKQATLELRETKDFLEKLLTYANAPIIVWNPDLTISRINNALERLTGLEANEIIGKNIDILFPAASRSQSMQKIMNTGSGEFLQTVEIPIQHKDGSVRIALWNSANIYADDNETLVATIAQGQDITDRYNAEIALQISQADLLESQRIAKLGSWRLDIATNQVKWTDELYRMYNFDPSLPPPPYTEHMKLFTSESWERLSTALANTAETGTPYEVELETVRKDGSNGWMWAYGETVCDSTGKTVGLHGAAQDITERVRNEKALRASEERLRKAFNTSSDIISITRRKDGVFVMVNEEFTRVTGLTEAEVIGKTSLEVNIWKDPNDLLNVYKALKKQGRLRNMEVTFLTKDGEGPGLLSASLVELDGELHVLNIVRDIADRKKAEDTIRQNISLLQATLESTADGILVVNSSGQVTSFNMRFVELWNIPEPLIGTKDDKQLIDYVLSQLKDPEQFLTGVQNLYADKTAHSFDTLDFKDGRVFERYSQPQMIDNVPVGRVWCFRDLTQRIKDEAEIKALNDSLEQKVAERTAQLTVAMKELEAFSHSVSHDLRAPLRGIDGWSMALLEDYHDKLDEKGKSNLETIRAEAQHMGKIIEALLNLSKMSRSEMELKETNLSQLARSVVKRLTTEEPERQINVNIQPDMTDKCDSRLMEIALTNLLGNAFKFSQNKAKAQIEFGRTQVEGKTAYYIKDNGVGFDMAHVDKLFGTFQRLHKITDFTGTGVGLATVKRIINRHGGSIWAKAEPDKYAIFYFTLREE